MSQFKGEKWHFRNEDIPSRALCGLSSPRLSVPLPDEKYDIECLQCRRLAVAARKKKLALLMTQREGLLLQVERLSQRIRKFS